MAAGTAAARAGDSLRVQASAARGSHIRCRPCAPKRRCTPFWARAVLSLFFFRSAAGSPRSFAVLHAFPPLDASFCPGQVPGARKKKASNERPPRAPQKGEVCAPGEEKAPPPTGLPGRPPGFGKGGEGRAARRRSARPKSAAGCTKAVQPPTPADRAFAGQAADAGGGAAAFLFGRHPCRGRFAWQQPSALLPRPHACGSPSCPLPRLTVRRHGRSALPGSAAAACGAPRGSRCTAAAGWQTPASRPGR